MFGADRGIFAPGNYPHIGLGKIGCVAVGWGGHVVWVPQVVWVPWVGWADFLGTAGGSRGYLVCTRVTPLEGNVRAIRATWRRRRPENGVFVPAISAGR